MIEHVSMAHNTNCSFVIIPRSQGKPQEPHPASENLEDKTLLPVLGHEALRKSWSHLVPEDAGERGAPPGREQHLGVFMSSPQHTWQHQGKEHCSGQEKWVLLWHVELEHFSFWHLEVRKTGAQHPTDISLPFTAIFKADQRCFYASW